MCSFQLVVLRQLIQFSRVYRRRFVLLYAFRVRSWASPLLSTRLLKCNFNDSVRSLGWAWHNLVNDLSILRCLPIFGWLHKCRGKRSFVMCDSYAASMIACWSESRGGWQSSWVRRYTQFKSLGMIARGLWTSFFCSTLPTRIWRNATRVTSPCCSHRCGRQPSERGALSLYPGTSKKVLLKIWETFLPCFLRSPMLSWKPWYKPQFRKDFHLLWEIKSKHVF